MYKFKRQLLLIVIVFLCTPVIGFADMPAFFDQPDSGYTSNVVTDMLVHNGGIWFATDEGLNFTLDGGATWLLYDNSNGLVSQSISAIASVGQRIWTATNHEENFDGLNLGISDGVSYSDDNGLTWHQIDFETAPNNIPYVWGGDRTIFDITGHYDPNNPTFDDWVFFTAFAGGFLASRDGGQSWKRIFPSPLDSAQFYVLNAQPSLRNRYFSCVADTSHGDSLFVWSGTAGGIFQYIFAEPKDKPITKHVTDIEFCSTCGSGDSSFIYYGGVEGFTRGNKINGSAFSKFEVDGLPGNHITAILDFGGILFLGTANEDYSSAGLALSTDFGDSFSPYTGTNSSEFIGAGKKISDFALLNDQIYMAVEENGLFVSPDTGNTWTKIDVDPLDVTSANRRNVVHAIDVIGDTLNLGTDSGLVRLYLSPSGTVDSSLHFVFAEDATASTRIINLATQTLSNSNQLLWTINVPLDTALNLSTPIVAISDDGGQTFIEKLNFNAYNTNIGILGDTAIILGDYGSLFSVNGSVVTEQYKIYERFVASIDTTTHDTTFVVLDSLNADSLTTIEIQGDTIVVGGNNGYAVSIDRGQNYQITNVNTDTLSADAVLNYTSSIFGIDGDWVPAIEVQYETTDPFARIWASTRPTYGGLPGISVGGALEVEFVDTLTNDTTISYERIWGKVYDNYAWNFAFASDTIFAATNDGLIYTVYDTSLGYVWTNVELEDDTGAPLLLEGTPVYAVEVDDNYVWVGTDDRTVRLNRDNLSLQEAFYVIDSTTPSDEVYAFPVPYSHVNSNAVDFHFVVNQQANITIEIYDFAMHLVRRVVDDVTFAPGIYPTVGADRYTWDGLNGKGDEVAVGMYYFKVTYSTGEVYWDKLAVIP